MKRLLVLLVLPVAPLQAVRICSDSATVTRSTSDNNSLHISYQHHVVVTLDNGTTARADAAFVDTGTYRCTLRGNVCVHQAGGTSCSDTVEFDLRTKQLVSTGSKQCPVETTINVSQLWGKKSHGQD